MLFLFWADKKTVLKLWSFLSILFKSTPVKCTLKVKYSSQYGMVLSVAGAGRCPQRHALLTHTLTQCSSRSARTTQPLCALYKLISLINVSQRTRGFLGVLSSFLSTSHVRYSSHFTSFWKKQKLYSWFFSVINLFLTFRANNLSFWPLSLYTTNVYCSVYFTLPFAVMVFSPRPRRALHGQLWERN